ncbi:hypothetical protein P7K49_029296 [Saguinus oedipus]|uniref:CTNNB1 binding N-teminal domain-containing protein n=1 Tax=Saguinus oedipus TaxID=9490 RepID=A0ABQ9U8U6_SAGOE|nr:hypothetical protein P7K49_029296 [Saguinus oedipus]
MPQLGGGGGGGGGGSSAGAAGGGDDLGANDELIPFQDEGGEEQEPSSDSASAQRDLDEVKSSLVNESENQSSSSDSEAERRPQPARDTFQKPRDYFAEGTCPLGQPPLWITAALRGLAPATHGTPRTGGRTLALRLSWRQPPWGAWGGGARVQAPVPSPLPWRCPGGPGLTSPWSCSQ